MRCCQGIHLDAASKGTIDAGKLGVPETRSQRGVARLMLGRARRKLASPGGRNQQNRLPFKGSLNALQYGYQTNASGDYPEQ